MRGETGLASAHKSKFGGSGRTDGGGQARVAVSQPPRLAPPSRGRRRHRFGRLARRVLQADELALDFANFRSAGVGTFAAELPPDLVAALTHVDAAFGPIVGDGWSEGAVRSAPEWATVRERAGVALRLRDRFES